MQRKTLTGILLDDEMEMSLQDLSQACQVQREWIVELVDEGILEPIGEDRTQWQFSGTSLVRARTVLRLQHDLNINLSGAALALDLLDEIETLRAQLRRFDLRC